jgi:hypothetical protein
MQVLSVKMSMKDIESTADGSEQHMLLCNARISDASCCHQALITLPSLEHSWGFATTWGRGVL